MSGICGVVNFDGRPIEPSDLEAMLSAMARRGPDGMGLWTDGPVGLGHAMLSTTPESLHECPPIVNQRGDLMITADVRLDNREELIDALGLHFHPATKIGDHALILGAYDKWGEACPSRLLGDFAFAIWDRKESKIFCARDILGIKPFYYLQSGALFVFGSAIEAVLRNPHVTDELNEGMIGEYLSGSIHRREETFYHGIFRLPGAYCMSVSQDKVRKNQYWSAGSVTSLHYRSKTDYVDHFIEIFAQAVTARLRTCNKVGALLSGGIDSSLVVSMMKRLQHDGAVDLNGLETFSLTFPGLPTDESSNIIEFSEVMGVQANLLAHNAPSLADCERHLKTSRGFPDTATGLAYYPIYKLARKQGIGVLFSGWGADDWLDTFNHYYADLISQGGLSTLANQFLSDSRRHNLMTAVDLLIRHGLRPLVPDKIRAAKRYLGKKLQKKGSRVPPWIQGDFAAQIDLQHRLTPTGGECSPRSRGDFQKQARIRWLNSGMLALNADLQESALASHGLEGRYPYNDQRIIEFGLSIPSQQRWLYKQRKGLLYATVKKLCPQLMSHAFSYPEGSPIYIDALASVGGEDAFSSLQIAKRGWINEAAIKTLCSEVFRQHSQGDHQYAHSVRTLWLVIAVELWAESL